MSICKDNSIPVELMLSNNILKQFFIQFISLVWILRGRFRKDEIKKRNGLTISYEINVLANAPE